MLEVMVDNKNGKVWEVSGIVSDVTYKTTKKGSPSSLDFTYIQGGLYESSEFTLDVGDIVRVRHDGQNLFYGYVFTVESGKEENVKVTAYDQTRYLLMNDTYVLKEATVGEIIERIASDFKLNTGFIADTQYKIPLVMEDNQKLMDIICKALDKTLIATTVNYIFYDNYGELTLRDSREMTVDIALGDTSLMYDFKQKRSIDNAANYIKIVQNNKEAGNRSVFVYEDTSTIGKWGKLQHYQVADEKLNQAQIEEMLKNLLKLKNRVERSFSIDAIGDSRLRAGCYVVIYLEELDIKQRFLINECTHKFEGADHTMSLEIMDIRVGDPKV